MSVKREKNKSFMRYRYLIFCLLTFLLAEDMTLQAPDGSTVFIHRDEYGVPHIVADNQNAVSFGQGFAEAQDRLYQMDLNRRGSLGRLSEWFGDQTLNMDKDIRRLGYTRLEYDEMFAELETEVQEFISAYADGVNTYVDSMTANPSKYKPIDYVLLEFEHWEVHHSLAFAVYFCRLFGMFGGEELIRLTELQDNGWSWFNENLPVNDTTCTTTLVDEGRVTQQDWTYSGMTIPDHIAQEVADHREAIRKFAEE